MDRQQTGRICSRRWRKLTLPFALICFLSLGHANLWAQTATYTGSLMQSAVRQGWIRYGVRYGRIKPVANNRSAIQSRSTKETLSIMGGLTPQLNVNYRYENEDKLFAFDSTSDTITIKHQVDNPTTKEPSVEFYQPQQGSLELLIDDGSGRRIYHAETIWHLYFNYPDICRRRLDPLLSGLRNGPPLSESVKQVEKAMIQRSKLDRSSPVDRWRVLVEQLGADSFAVRRAADTELRESGQAAIAFLLSYDMKDLEPEQQMRVRRIIRSLEPGDEEDSADRAAAYLFSQPTAWLSLLGSENKESRTIAKAELEKLLEHSVNFDPSASKEKREEQIDIIKSTLP